MAELVPQKTFEALEWQRKPWLDKSYVMCLSSSAGTGKSRLAYEKICALAMKFPDSTIALIRKTRESLRSSVVSAILKTVLVGDEWGTYNKSEGTFYFKTGSVMHTVGFKDEEQREGIRSIGQDGGLDFALVEEAKRLYEEDFNEVLGRMRGTATYNYYRTKYINAMKKRGMTIDRAILLQADAYARDKEWHQIMVITNPGHPYHWIKRRLIDGKQASCYQPTIKDNPHLPRKYVENLQNLTGVQYQHLVLGNWVAAEGAVIDEYDEKVHVIPNFDIPKDWRRFRSVDWGYRNPAAVLWGALSPDGDLYIYRQIYITQTLVQTLAKRVIELSKHSDGTPEDIEATIADTDAGDRATFETYGIPTIPAIKTIDYGIKVMKKRFKIRSDNKKPRIFIFKDTLDEADDSLLAKHEPIELKEELYYWVWDERTNDYTGLKEKPIDKYNHACDALRYMIMYLDREMAVDVVSLSGILLPGEKYGFDDLDKIDSLDELYMTFDDDFLSV